MTSARAWLVDQRWFKAYPLGPETTIGRGVDCTIILRDLEVSRTHAKVRKTSDGYELVVEGATETRVNGAPVPEPREPRALREGDVVEIAFTALQFTYHPPTGEMLVIAHDAPTPLETTEGPTRATLRAVKRSAIFGGSRRGWRRLWYWLTRRAKTD